MDIVSFYYIYFTRTCVNLVKASGEKKNFCFMFSNATSFFFRQIFKNDYYNRYIVFFFLQRIQCKCTGSAT